MCICHCRSHPFYSGKESSGNIRIMRDVLLTYAMYNFDLGYCQGMSDLLSPILYVMRDEVEAFWAFAALMDRLESNFHTDQRGMHAQLLALRRLVQVRKCVVLGMLFMCHWLFCSIVILWLSFTYRVALHNDYRTLLPFGPQCLLMGVAVMHNAK